MARPSRELWRATLTDRQRVPRRVVRLKGGSLVAALFGVTLGVVAGYFTGAIDRINSSLVNVMLAFAFVLLALAVNLLGDGLSDLLDPYGRNTITVRRFSAARWLEA